tara:strand:+ start:104299 stop:104889 length:591 start_codon:yes stop_codon:yes gene_type:complete
MSKHITPAQKKKALILRSAGWTITTISDKTNISVSSLKRLFKTHSVKRGEIKEAVIKEATNQLIKDAATIENIKIEAAALLQDDLVMVRRLRAAMAEAIDNLSSKDTTEALQVMRAISAGAVALKSTSETSRRTLGLDKIEDTLNDLPELTIRVLTENEMEEMKSKAANLSAGTEDGMGGVLTNHLKDEIVAEGFD